MPHTLYPRGRVPGACCVGGFVGPTAGLNTGEEKYLLLLWGIKLIPDIQPIVCHYTDWAILALLQKCNNPSTYRNTENFLSAVFNIIPFCLLKLCRTSVLWLWILLMNHVPFTISPSLMIHTSISWIVSPSRSLKERNCTDCLGYGMARPLQSQ
jgi:hypothetical protein